MQIVVRSVEQLCHDPANVREHDPKNLAAIKASLRRFGQQKPIVIHGDMVVAGNGTLEAARALGWETLECVETDLDAAIERTAYAIADNRAGELARWHEEARNEQLLALAQHDVPLSDVGFADVDLAALGRDEGAPLGEGTKHEGGGGDDESDESDEEDGQAGQSQLGELEYRIVVRCDGEDHQARLLAQFEREGLAVQALMS